MAMIDILLGGDNVKVPGEHLKIESMLSSLMNKQFITTIIILISNFVAARNPALQSTGDREVELEMASEI